MVRPLLILVQREENHNVNAAAVMALQLPVKATTTTSRLVAIGQVHCNLPYRLPLHPANVSSQSLLVSVILPNNKTNTTETMEPTNKQKMELQRKNLRYFRFPMIQVNTFNNIVTYYNSVYCIYCIPTIPLI